MEQTFCLFAGVGLISRNVEDLAGSLELNLLLHNHRVVGTGLPFFPDHLLVECRNWEAAVGNVGLDNQMSANTLISRNKLE